MIRNFAVSCLVVGFSVSSFAAEATFESTLETNKQKLTKLEARKDAITKKISDLDSRMTNAQWNFDKASTYFEDKSAVSDKQRDIYMKAKADKEKTAAEVNPELIKLKSETQAVNDELAALKDKVAGETYAENIQKKTTQVFKDYELKKTQYQYQTLQELLRTANLRMSFVELDLKRNGVDNTLDNMERMYDKSILGAYLQDKMGQLLNSQVVCSAVKRCITSDPKKIEPERIRKELFSESAEGAIRSDYYKKVNRKEATPIQ